MFYNYTDLDVLESKTMASIRKEMHGELLILHINNCFNEVAILWNAE